MIYLFSNVLTKEVSYEKKRKIFKGSHQPHFGPLSPHASKFRNYLSNLGYSEGSIDNLVTVLHHLSRWMSVHGIRISNLSVKHMDQFLVHRRKQLKYVRFLSRQALQPIIQFLIKEQLLTELKAPKKSLSLIEKVIEEFHKYLIEEKQIKKSSASSVCKTSQRFFLNIIGERLNYQKINPKSIRSFILSESKKYSPSTTRASAGSLRSLLHWLYLQKKIPQSFRSAIPKISAWKRKLPTYVSSSDIELLLNSCDRKTHKGRRVYAMILLMAYLGLRKNEVSALTLDCINWSAGEIKIQNSKGSGNILPLPSEIGRALSSYIQKSRPGTASRNIFFGVKAPYHPITPSGVSHALKSICMKTGVRPFSTHQFRHVAACKMLKEGCSLQEIGQVLRHKSINTTSIYAKVDDISLGNVIQKWVGGEQ